MAEFWVKYTFRIIHVTTASLIIGNVLTDGVFGKRDIPYYSVFMSVLGVVLFVAGIVNIVLLRAKETMGEARKPWLWAIILKIVLWVGLLPLPELLAKLIGFEFPRSTFNLFIVIAAILTSSFAKQYRDWFVLKRIKKD